jgi:hypothetical protein
MVMRNLVLAAIALVGAAALAHQSFQQTSTAAVPEIQGVKLAEGFYQVTPPPGVDEAFVVTPVRQVAANGTTMVEVATTDEDEEEVVVYAPRAPSVFQSVVSTLSRR